MIDARPQTGTAPDEQTEMRYPTRASELDHRRLHVPPSPLHDPSPNQLRAVARAKNAPIVRAVLDKGHQSKPTLWSGGLIDLVSENRSGHSAGRELEPERWPCGPSHWAWEEQKAALLLVLAVDARATAGDCPRSAARRVMKGSTGPQP